MSGFQCVAYRLMEETAFICFSFYRLDHSTCEVASSESAFSCSTEFIFGSSATAALGPSNKIAISSKVGPLVSTNKK